MTLRLGKCGFPVATTVVCCVGGNTAAWAQDHGPAVVPYRPSVATPAELPARGWPESWVHRDRPEMRLSVVQLSARGDAGLSGSSESTFHEARDG